MLGISINCVKARLLRALVNLRDHLAPIFGMEATPLSCPGSESTKQQHSEASGLLLLLDNYLAWWPDASASLFRRDGTATYPPSSIESHNQNHL